jgi:hypothetical protein
VELESRYNEEAGELEVFQFKTVVEKVLDPETQIAIEEAKRDLDEEAEPGDSLGMKIDAASFGRSPFRQPSRSSSRRSRTPSATRSTTSTRTRRARS